MSWLIARWCEFSRSERISLARVAVLAMIYRAALALVPWKAIVRYTPRVRCDSNALALPRVRWAASVVRHRLPFQTCLSSALATRHELARQGIAAEVEIGVVERDGRREFHATVVAGGIRFDADESMITLVTLRGQR